MVKPPKILVVDDEESICYVLKVNLEIAGYSVDVANSAEAALRLNLEKYDLFLLDVMMERMSGFEMAEKLRQNEKLKDVPIIFCTAKDAEDDLLKGFSTGADDYIKKPFSMKELTVRVKSVLHRSGRLGNDEILTYETLVINLKDRTCKIDDSDVQLTKKEFDIIAFLLKNKDRIFSREEILLKVWSDDVYVIDRTIDVNINRLRKKLGTYGNNIITKLGYGYGFSTRD
jgi:two-component system alkaline phosphatase synthesis response regulator PhoP